jgi:hypothetical protein
LVDDYEKRRAALRQGHRRKDRDYTAYCGAYVVHEADRFAIHRLAFSLYPNGTGTDQKRFFQLSGDRLALTTPPFLRKGEQATARLVWEQLR